MSLLFEQRQKESSFDDLGPPSSSSYPAAGRNVGQSQNEEESTRNHLRKYLVLLHDCLAIKFVPLVPSSTSTPATHSHPFAINSNHRNYGGGSNNQILNYSLDHQRLNSKSKSNTGLSSSSISSLLRGDRHTFEVDHSIHGLHLYRDFREANLKCHWNSALYEAFRSLEYRGFIVPSIIIVWGIPRSFTTIRTAWSRQMIRSPPGFRIEFIGEIEELIADPIQQSQFAPLSDSLCWIILEITSIGQEAFVDSILQGLSNAFPKMVKPNRELVYSTLEKLTRERKVYQTSQGYFVVTPDTFRYMVSSNNAQDLYGNNGMVTLDALLCPQQKPDAEKESLSRHSWDSAGSGENSSSPTRVRPTRSFGDEESISDSKDTRLRRHNSLKIIRQRDNPGTSKGLGFRSMSFRLYKSKSVHNTAEDSSPTDKLSREMQKLCKPDDPAPRRNSLSKTALGKFRKLFRKSNSSSSKQAGSSNKKNGDPPITKSSASTQTPVSPVVSPVPKNSPKPSPDRIIIARPTITESDPNPNPSFGRFTLPFEPKEDYSNKTTCWNSLPHRQKERPCSRQSLGDDHGSHLYATPTSPENFPGIGNGHRSQNLIGFPFSRGESSRCSTLSQGTSLGYGSQGQGTSLQGFMSQSPSPSMSPSGAAVYPGPPVSMSRNGKNYYDHYRRRYPTYTYAGPNTKPISHYEVVRSKIPDMGTSSSSSTPKATTEMKKTGEISNGHILSTTTTTTVNSTNNIELEVSLPIGKMRKSQSANTTMTNGKTKNLGNSTNGNTHGPIKTTFSVHPSNSNNGATEVTTTVNQNGRIETHFDCDSGENLNPRVQIKVTNPRATDLILANGKTMGDKLVASH